MPIGEGYCSASFSFAPLSLSLSHTLTLTLSLSLCLLRPCSWARHTAEHFVGVEDLRRFLQSHSQSRLSKGTSIIRYSYFNTYRQCLQTSARSKKPESREIKISPYFILPRVPPNPKLNSTQRVKPNIVPKFCLIWIFGPLL